MGLGSYKAIKIVIYIQLFPNKEGLGSYKAIKIVTFIKLFFIEEGLWP